MLAIKKKIFPLLLFIGVICTVGCKALLAPEYDKAIVDTVTSTSEKTMSFFAKVSEGTSNSDFSEREKDYNDLIGSYEALKIKAKARPIPKNIATKKITELLGSRGNALNGEYPSAYAFEEISETLKKMKKKDGKTGLKPTAVEAFKGQIEIYLDQALTYESFLKR